MEQVHNEGWNFASNNHYRNRNGRSAARTHTNNNLNHNLNYYDPRKHNYGPSYNGVSTSNRFDILNQGNGAGWGQVGY